MKINKKFKILPILLIPAIAIPLILTSCSSVSNSTTLDPKTSTIFENSVNASVDNQLNKILPSESTTTSNKNNIISFILSNSIIGKKNNLEPKDINVHTITADDINGTLEVTYHIKNYWENDKLIPESKEIKLTLTGFVKQTTPTTFLKTPSKSIASVTNLASLSTNLLGENKSLLQEWLFNNEISGNKETLTSNDIQIVNFTDGNAATGTTTIQYDVMRYWTGKGISNNKQTFTIQLSGFKAAQLTGDEILKEINASGTIGGLTIDRFSPIVAYLNLSNKTRLNTLTDAELNSRLNVTVNTSLNGLTLAIESGNQQTKSLTLTISGTYKNVTIPVGQQQITISGFHNTIDEYEPGFNEFRNNIYISDIFFDLNAYFNNLQLSTDISTWTSADWMTKYLSNLTIRKIPATNIDINFNLVEYVKNKIFDTITFNNVADAITSQSWVNLNMNANYSNYQYDKQTKQWTVLATNRTTYSFRTTSDLAFNIPTQQDALNWIAKNKTTFDEGISSRWYASYWYSLYRNTNDISSINTVILVDRTYKTKYFNNQTISVSLDSMAVKDMVGEMVITYKLILGESTTSVPTNLETNSFQKLKTFIDANSAELDNLIQVLPKNTKSTLERSIIRAIRRDFTADFLKAMKVDEVANAKGKPVLFKNSSSYRLFNGDASTNDSKLDEKFLEDIRPFLFRKALSRNYISVDMNLFMPDGRKNNQTKFAINSIVVDINETSIATVTRFNATHFTYKVPFTYFIDLGDATPMVEIPSYYFMSVAYSDLYTN